MLNMFYKNFFHNREDISVRGDKTPTAYSHIRFEMLIKTKIYYLVEL